MEALIQYSELAVDAMVRYAPRLAIALLLGVIGWKVISLLSSGVRKALSNKRVDPSLRPFLSSLLEALLKVALAVTLIGYLGIPTASFVAVMGAAGLAVGLALSGTLQNFAGGVLLLLIRPFRVGDFIEAQGFLGTVHEIQIFQTIVLTPDNRTIFVPNGKLANEAITNFSVQEKRRIDETIGIGYEADISRARGILEGLLEADPRVHQEPKPLVAVTELADSSVNLLVRFWVNRADFFTVGCELRERAKLEFDAAGISIPFPQREVHLVRGED